MRDEYHVTTEDYRGFQIEVYYDTDPQNPWKDWDGQPPIAVYADRGIHEYGEENGHANSVPTLTREQIKANTGEILSFLDAKSWLGVAREYIDRRYPYGSIEDAINEAISERLDREYDSNRLPFLRDIYEWAGIPALYSQVTGSSQSDWAYVLAVATPEFREFVGNPDYGPDELKHDIQLYEDWAFGNVYGYVIKDADGDDIDSCWGFYGDYEDYMLKECRSFVDNHIEREAKQTAEAELKSRLNHFRKVKAWIRNRVPLHYRHFAV